MRKARINPCERKGELVAGKARDNAFQSGARRRYGPCECANAFRCIGKGGERLRYAMNTQNGELSDLINPERILENTIPVVPCGEQFREHNSKGTKLYKKLAGEKTKFQGCQALEEGLIEKNLVRPWIHDRERLELSNLLDKVVPTEEHFSLPISSESLSTFRDAFSKADDEGIDENKWSVNKFTQTIQFTINHTIADFVRTPPADYRQSHVRKLFEEGYFYHEDKKRVALYLISKGITDKETVQELLPKIPYKEYKSYEASAFATIEATLPERARVFTQFLDSLTISQRKAVDLLYLKNEYGFSQNQIAEKLGITIDSFIDRINGAKKKLFKKFPDLKPVRRNEVKVKIPSSEGASGIKSLKEEKMLVVQIDPKTGGRTNLTVSKNPKDRIRYKVGVNREELRIKIAIMCPIPYPVI